MNKVVLTGEICDNFLFTDEKRTKNGKIYLRFKLKVTHSNNTEFIPIVFWGKLAEEIKDDMLKGEKVLIEGSLKSFSYKKEGKTYQLWEVVGKSIRSISIPELNSFEKEVFDSFEKPNSTNESESKKE